MRAQVLSLLCVVQDRHDLALVRYPCDRVALIHCGELVEEGEADRIFDHSESAYARMLIQPMPEVRVPA